MKYCSTQYHFKVNSWIKYTAKADAISITLLQTIQHKMKTIIMKKKECSMLIKQLFVSGGAFVFNWCKRRKMSSNGSEENELTIVFYMINKKIKNVTD